MKKIKSLTDQNKQTIELESMKENHEEKIIKMEKDFEKLKIESNNLKEENQRNHEEKILMMKLQSEKWK